MVYCFCSSENAICGIIIPSCVLSAFWIRVKIFSILKLSHYPLKIPLDSVYETTTIKTPSPGSDSPLFGTFIAIALPES